MDIYFKRDKIRKLKKIFKSMKFKIVSLKLDFDILYNNYKEENVEIVHIGEEESLRILIEEEKLMIKSYALQFRVKEIRRIAYID